MSPSERFAAYAAAFEEAFRSDDWSQVGPFFADDAVYVSPLGPPPLGGRFEGREAVVAYLKDVLDRFDRRFETREIELLEGPRETDGRVWVRGRARYRAPGVPELVFELEEEAHYEDGLIRHLEDRYAEDTRRAVWRWLDRHAGTVGIAWEGGEGA